MKNNVIYGGIFVLITILGVVFFYLIYQTNYVNFDNSEITISQSDEYWTNGNVGINVEYTGKMKVSEYSFDGGRTWQKTNTYSAKSNEKLSVILKGSYGKQSVPIQYRVGNIDKEIPTIAIADTIYTAKDKEFIFDDYLFVEDKVSGIVDTTITGAENIDIATIGEYTVDVMVTDRAGNMSNKSVIVSVVDKKDPNLPENQKSDINVIGVSVDKTKVNLVKGTTVKVIPTVKPANATNKKVTWRSVNTSVAKVDNKGVITAVEAGSTTVSVTTLDGQKVSEISVVVSDQAIDVSSVTLDRKTDTFTTDDPDIVLTATVKPETATNTTITWSSSNLSVASVKDGRVSIRGEGETTISAASNNGKIATYHLIVKDNYVFQTREVKRQGKVNGYRIIIYKNGVDITKDVDIISAPISVRHNIRKRFEVTLNQYNAIQDEIEIMYASDKHKVYRAQTETEG